MPSTDELLAKLGLSHVNMHTHFTEIQFSKPKTFDDLVAQIYAGFEKLKKAHPEMKDDDLKIDHIAITFGHADAVIVWWASDSKWAKLFRDNVLASNDQRSMSLLCYINDGVHHG